MVVLIWNDLLNVPDRAIPTLLPTMKEMIKRTQKFDYSRAFPTAICDMDDALRLALPEDEMVAEAVGVLAMTNSEFLDLITLTIRKIQQSPRPCSSILEPVVSSQIILNRGNSPMLTSKES
jgi:hypothetical protein